MKIKVKYISKVTFMSSGITFTEGGQYTIDEELFNRFSKKFEKIEAPKPELKSEPEVVKPKPAPKPKRKPQPKED